jgi:hypothetical protein
VKFFVGKTAAKRAAGQRPSRTKAFTAATATGSAVGALTYKLLRSSGSDGSGDSDD